MTHATSDIEKAINDLLSDSMSDRFGVPEVNLRSANVEPGIVLDGTYRIVRLIGEGGMGSVYEAFNVTLERRVAIKVIRRAFSSIPDFLKRFRQEAVTMAKVDHPNVVRIHHCEVRSDAPSYIVMEYVDGETLADLLKRRGKLSHQSAAGICRQILRALHVMHREGVIHRDLKPANIMLTEGPHGPRVRICDFGLGKMLEQSDSSQAGTELTEVGAVLGTPNYMSPEQCLGKKVSESSDIYSAGIVLFEMLSGRPPFKGGSKHSTIMRQITSPPPLDALSLDTPRGFRLVLAKALSKEPSLRYGGAVSMLRALGTIKEPKTEKKTHGRIALAAALSLILVCLGFGAYLGLRQPSGEVPSVPRKAEVAATLPRPHMLKSAPPEKVVRPLTEDSRTVRKRELPAASVLPEKWPRNPKELLHLAQSYGDSGERTAQSEALRRFLRACKKRRSATCSRANRRFARARLAAR